MVFYFSLQKAMLYHWNVWFSRFLFEVRLYLLHDIPKIQHNREVVLV